MFGIYKKIYLARPSGQNVSTQVLGQGVQESGYLKLYSPP